MTNRPSRIGARRVSGIVAALAVTLTACGGSGDAADSMRGACDEVTGMNRALTSQDVDEYETHWSSARDLARHATDAVPEWEQAEELAGTLDPREAWGPDIRTRMSLELCAEAFPGEYL